jgi:hypothetical protein
MKLLHGVKRPTILAALFVGLLGLASAPARADFLTQKAVFATSGQSLWQPGSAAFNFNKSLFLGAEWGALRTSLPSLPAPPPLTGFFTGSANLAPGKAGFQFSLQATSGSVDASYPVELTYAFPHRAKAGSQVTVGTKYVQTGTPSLSTLGPAFQAALNLIFDVNAAIRAKYTPLIGKSVSGVANIGINQKIPLITIGSGSGGVTFKLPLPGFSISANLPPPLNLPNPPTSPLMAQGNTVKVGGSSSPPFVSLNVELVDVIVAALNSLGVPVPPLTGDAKVDLKKLGISFGLEYKILSDLIQIGPKFRQDFQFTAKNLPITLTSNIGQSFTGHVGDSFHFTMPAKGPLLIDANVGLNNTLTNKTGIVLGADQTFSVLSGSLVVGNTTLINFGPLLSKTIPLETKPLYLYTNTFPLQGFNTVHSQIAVLPEAPEPSSLVLALVGMGTLALRFRRSCLAGC